MVAGKWGMYSGDGDANNTINNTDKTAVWTPNAGKKGYLNADFNRNGQVNNPDKNNYWIPNIGKSFARYLNEKSVIRRKEVNQKTKK